MQKPLSPHTTMVIFDIHGVLCKAKFSEIIKTFFHSPYRGVIFRHALRPKLWIDAFRLWRQAAVAGTYIAFVKAHYPKLIPCIPLFIHMANSQEPNNSVLAIIKKLKAQGYTLNVLSNIDDEILADLRSTPCGQMLIHFDEVMGTQAHSQGKPSPDMYKDFIAQHNGDHKTMIFIDNRRRNVRGARRAGMIGILFKNAHQLEHALRRLGIVVA